MKPEIIGLLGILLLFLLTSSFSYSIISGSTDDDRVKATINDANADYLLSKLEAGNNITLTLQNPGGDENILISATGGGGSDTNCSLNPNCIIKTIADINAGAAVVAYNPTTGFRVGEKSNNNCIRFFPNADGLGVTGGLLLPCVEGMLVGLNGVATFGNIDIKGSLRNYNTAVAPVISGINQFVFESQVAGGGSGLQFHDSAFSFDFKVGNTSYAQFHVPGVGVLRLRPSSIEPPPVSGDKNFSGSQCMFKNFADGNFWMCQQKPDQNFLRLQQSAYGQREVIQGNDINGMMGIRTPGSISFYGVNDSNNVIDYNVGTDRNQMYFLTIDRNSSFLFSQTTSGGQRIDSFYLDGNGNPSFFRVPSTSATLSNLQWDVNTGKIFIRASDAGLKENVQDNPYDASWCYELDPKIWTDKATGYPGIGYMAQDVENLLKSYNIPTWMTPTDSYGNKLILYDAVRDFCWKAAIQDHERLVQVESKMSIIVQLVCPVGKIDPLCDLLNQ